MSCHYLSSPLLFSESLLCGNDTKDSSKSFPWESHSLGRSVCFSSPVGVGMRNCLCREVLYTRWIPAITNTFLTAWARVMFNTLLPPNQVSNLAKGIWLLRRRCVVLAVILCWGSGQRGDNLTMRPACPFLLLSDHHLSSWKDLYESQVCKSQSRNCLLKKRY